MLIEIGIQRTEEVTPGVYRTELSHPDLQGTLFFFHSKGQEGLVLSNLDKSIPNKIKEIAALFKDLTSTKEKV